MTRAVVVLVFVVLACIGLPCAVAGGGSGSRGSGDWANAAHNNQGGWTSGWTSGWSEHGGAWAHRGEGSANYHTWGSRDWPEAEPPLPGAGGGSSSWRQHEDRWESGSQASNAWSTSSWTNIADPRELGKGTGTGSIKGSGKDTGKGKANGGDTPASRSGPRPEGSAGASSSTAGPQASRSGPRPEGSAGASSSSTAGPQASHSGPRPEGSATRHVEGSALGKREVTNAVNDGILHVVEYICGVCKKAVKRSQFMLDVDSHGDIIPDWQGRLSGQCSDCSEGFTKQEAERR